MGLTEKDYQLIDDLITDRLNESAYVSLKERAAQYPEFADELRRKIVLTKAIESSQKKKLQKSYTENCRCKHLTFNRLFAAVANLSR